MKTFSESEVRELLAKQVKACSEYLERETYCLRSPTPNIHTKRWTLENLHTIVNKTPLIR